MRRYLSTPAIFQIPGFLLCLATAAANMHRGDIADAEFDLGLGFDIDWLGVGGNVGLLAILSNSQVKARHRRHSNYKTDIEGAARGGEIMCESSHGAERVSWWDPDRGTLTRQLGPIAGGRLQATVEIRLFVDGSLSLYDAVVGGPNIKGTLKHIASPKFSLRGRQFRRRLRNRICNPPGF
jgi:hypothetical protein